MMAFTFAWGWSGWRGRQRNSSRQSKQTERENVRGDMRTTGRSDREYRTENERTGRTVQERERERENMREREQYCVRFSLIAYSHWELPTGVPRNWNPPWISEMGWKFCWAFRRNGWATVGSSAGSSKIALIRRPGRNWFKAIPADLCKWRFIVAKWSGLEIDHLCYPIAIINCSYQLWTIIDYESIIDIFFLFPFPSTVIFFCLPPFFSSIFAPVVSSLFFLGRTMLTCLVPED